MGIGLQQVILLCVGFLVSGLGGTGILLLSERMQRQRGLKDLTSRSSVNMEQAEDIPPGSRESASEALDELMEKYQTNVDATPGGRRKRRRIVQPWNSRDEGISGTPIDAAGQVGRTNPETPATDWAVPSPVDAAAQMGPVHPDTGLPQLISPLFGTVKLNFGGQNPTVLFTDAYGNVISEVDLGQISEQDVGKIRAASSKMPSLPEDFYPKGKSG
jgi:hypothetical protein